MNEADKSGDRTRLSDAQESAREFDFSSRYSSNFPQILASLNISLALTSYQSQRLILVRAVDGELDTNLKIFPRPMGVYADHERITLGTMHEVIDFKRSDDTLGAIKSGKLDSPEYLPRKLQEQDPRKAESFQKTRNQQIDAAKRSDALFCQRAALTTGKINIHDIAWGHEGLWVVNSTFSCLSTLSPDCSFVARWRPFFITEYAAEDRCHLNGMAMLDGAPRYVTTFNQENRQDSWHNNVVLDGTLMDVRSNQILLDGLLMPHSPRCYRGLVYFCESGRGEVKVFDPVTGKATVLCQLPGFTRGMTFMGDLMLVGTSRLRVTERQTQMPLEKELGAENSQSGIWLLNPLSGEILGNIIFEGDVEQIYDIAVIHNACIPELVQSHDVLAGHLFDFFEENIA